MSKKKYRSGGYSNRRGRMKSPRVKSMLNTKWKKFTDSTRQGKNGLKKWSDLNNLHDQLLDFFKPVTNLPKVIKENNYLDYLTKEEMIIFTSLTKMLARDNRLYLKELKMIENIHREKKGKVKIDDIELIFDIADKYLLWSQSYQATTSLTYDHLVDYLGMAETRKQRILNKEKEVETSTDNTDTETSTITTNEELNNG